MEKEPLHLFAVTSPGLEAVCARELTALGLAGVRPVPGGVEFSGGLPELYLANLRLRTASRLLVRVGEVRSRDFPDLFRRTVRLPWGRFVHPGTRLRVRAASHRSRLGHTGRIAETAVAAVDRALGRAEAPEGGAEQLVLVRCEEDVCRFSVDSSGELLHRRGYREETARAPLRETLAAGILLLLDWDGSTPLVDPMCGSGTLPVEGALLARRRPPGGMRTFAFMGWPRYRPGLWQALLAEARGQEREPPAAIVGADRDPRAVAAAGRNAGRAGVLADLELRQQEISCLAAPAGAGLVVCNPPYGGRLGRDEDLRPLYRRLGQVYREAFAGWQGAFLCPDPALARATGLPLEERGRLDNGGIPVVLYSTEL